MENNMNEAIYKEINAICLTYYNKKSLVSPVQLVEDILRNIDLPMYCAEQHFLIPAVLLTAYHRLKNSKRQLLETDLIKAAVRSSTMLPDFCSWNGVCGAAAGSGIFLSVLSGPDSCPEENDWVNTIVSDCLAEVMGISRAVCCKRICFANAMPFGGCMKENMKAVLEAIPIEPECFRKHLESGRPRCYRHVCFSTVNASVRFMKKNMKLNLGETMQTVCRSYDCTDDCTRLLCPFYKKEQAKEYKTEYSLLAQII